MSLSRGTGYPLKLRCAGCKGIDNGRGFDLAATGRTRSLRDSERGRLHPRMMSLSAEYRCLGCGHVGWSRHAWMVTLLRLGGFPVPVYDPVHGYREAIK